ncbi:MAG: hypothetical protein NTZ72_04045 [Afipia sp.]|nr:hypothetical protein [Afipia sp.]
MLAIPTGAAAASPSIANEAAPALAEQTEREFLDAYLEWLDNEH